MDTNQSIDNYVKILKKAYNAFNERDIASALELMMPNVTWPRAFKGGFVQGHQEIKAYWQEQWHEINPKVVPIDFEAMNKNEITVTVNQIVKNLDGQILADEHVKHTFTFTKHLIQGMKLEE